MKCRSRCVSLICTSLALVASLTIPANATFPGKNGRIAFIQDGEVFTMNPDGSEIKQLTHLGPDNSATFPAWSADGKQIVFNESPPPDGIPQLWVMNADGSDQHQVFAESDYSERRPSFLRTALRWFSAGASCLWEMEIHAPFTRSESMAPVSRRLPGFIGIRPPAVRCIRRMERLSRSSFRTTLWPGFLE